MRTISFFSALLFLCLALPTFAEHTCGTAQILNYLNSNHKTVKQMLASTRAYARTTSDGCTTKDYYDSVYSRTTKHFEIFYTLKGPHKTTLEFIDSLEKGLEYAWDFHVKKSGMLPPKGISVTHHYEKNVQNGLYPVEVIDIYLLRDYKAVMDSQCSTCFGLTIPFDNEESEMLMENDFKHIPEGFFITDTVRFNNKVCTYPRSSEEFTNETYYYSYAKHFSQAIRVTAAHELYHAVQFRYSSQMPQYNFWFEASASGVEELAVPEIDDYFTYLPKMAQNIGFPYKNLDRPYGAGIFFLYLHNHVSHKTNRLIWENFAKAPTKTFQYQLEQVSKSQGLSADSLFHDFAIRLSFTGDRSSLADSTFWITSDQPRWPKFQTRSQKAAFEPTDLDNTAYFYYANGTPDISNFVGRASAIAIKPQAYSIRLLPSSNSIDSANTEFLRESSVDSILWVFSRFSEEEAIPTIFKDSTLRAYPTPWRNGPLCFTPLPQNKDYIEIRNRRGNLVKKIEYGSHTLCIDENEVKSLMVPGVYRFRAGNSGKLKDFIIVY
ncbi:MAG: hypothetical protein IK114_14645 [Fibrobacter sp.]|nr:hypothetical protein [Fibrobacter sp.]